METPTPPSYTADDSVYVPLEGSRRRWTLPLFGGLAVAAADVAAILISAAVSWFSSVCNDDPSVVASKQHALRTDLLLVWLVAATVPLAVAGLARSRGRGMWPWVVLSGPPLAAALVLGATAHPSTWCLY